MKSSKGNTKNAKNKNSTVKIPAYSSPKRLPDTIKFKVLKAEMRKPKTQGAQDFCEFSLLWRKKKIQAFSFKNFAKRNFKLLKEGFDYKITGTKRVQNISKIHKSSKTTAKTEWIFDRITVLEEQSINLKQVKALLKGKKDLPKTPVANVKLEDGSVYRYMGCPDCTKSISSPSQNHFFECKSCPWKGAESQRKSYMIIRDISLQDSTGTLEDVVCFNSDCEILFNKKSEDFVHDQEAQILLESFFNSTISLEISSKESKNPRYPKIIVANTIKIIKKSSQQGSKTVLYDPSPSTENGTQIELQISTKFSKIKLHENTVSRVKVPARQTRSYELTSQPTGHVMIINNIFFPTRPKGDRSRLGSEKDDLTLQILFEELDFKVFIFEVKNKQDLKTRILNYKKRLVLKDVNCSIVIVMSHGCLNHIELTDGQLANIWTDIIDEFSDEKFSKFVGRPKIFAFGACQAFATEEPPKGIISYHSPRLSDMLLCFPGVPGYVTYRQEGHGSIFIQVLASVISKYAVSWSLEEILKETQVEMEKIKVAATITEGNGSKKTLDVTQMGYYVGFKFNQFKFKVPPLS